MKRNNNDCFFYYNALCYRGNNCPFRHEPRARHSNHICRLWRKRRCFKLHCPNRHAYIVWKFPQFRGSQFWEDRRGRTPFLISRYFNSQLNNSDDLKWTRRVYFTSERGSTNCKIHDGISADNRRWNGDIQERIHPKENIRVVLDRVGEPTLPMTDNMSSQHCRGHDDRSHELSQNIKSEFLHLQSPQTTYTNGVHERFHREVKPFHVSSNFGINLEDNGERFYFPTMGVGVKPELHHIKTNNSFGRLAQYSSFEVGNTSARGRQAKNFQTSVTSETSYQKLDTDGMNDMSTNTCGTNESLMKTNLGGENTPANIMDCSSLRHCSDVGTSTNDIFSTSNSAQVWNPTVYSSWRGNSDVGTSKKDYLFSNANSARVWNPTVSAVKGGNSIERGSASSTLTARELTTRSNTSEKTSSPNDQNSSGVPDQSVTQGISSAGYFTRSRARLKGIQTVK